MSIAFRLDGLRIRSVANVREHHMARARRTAQHRALAKMATCAALAGAPALREPWLTSGGLVVLLTRVGPRRLDDDNLAHAFKAIRDGIAEALGIDDGDPRVSWRYAQAKGPYGAHVLMDVLGGENHPLSRGGETSAENLQVTHSRCNIQKGARVQ